MCKYIPSQDGGLSECTKAAHHEGPHRTFLAPTRGGEPVENWVQRRRGDTVTVSDSDDAASAATAAANAMLSLSDVDTKRKQLYEEVVDHLDAMKRSNTSVSRTIDDVAIQWEPSVKRGKNWTVTFPGKEKPERMGKKALAESFRERVQAYTEDECAKRINKGLTIVVESPEAADPLMQRLLKTAGANVLQTGFRAPLPPLPAGDGGNKGLDEHTDDELRALRTEVDSKIREREVKNAVDRALEEERRGLKRDRDSLDASAEAFAKEKLEHAEAFAKEQADFAENKRQVDDRMQAIQSAVSVYMTPVGRS